MFIIQAKRRKANHCLVVAERAPWLMQMLALDYQEACTLQHSCTPHCLCEGYVGGSPTDAQAKVQEMHRFLYYLHLKLCVTVCNCL